MTMTKTNKTLALSALALALLASTTSISSAANDRKSKTKTFNLVPSGISRVTFESDAPIENIVGITSAVSGAIVIDLDSPTASPSARVSVALAKVRTGIAKRDEHMRSGDFLDTANHPTAVFELERVVLKGSLANRRGVKATLHGKFTLHGVSRDVAVAVVIGHRKATADMAKFGIKGDVLRIKGSFKIAMSDYGIKVPSKLGAKVSNTVKISLALTSYTG
jgi:polyisoprenoid-binding protein YceI